MSSSTAGSKLLLLTLLTAAGLVASATAATVYAAGDVQRREARLAKPPAASALEHTRHWQPMLALVDSITDALGPREPMDSAFLTEFVAIVASPADSAQWVPHTAPSLAAGAPLTLFRRLAHLQPLPAFWGQREAAGAFGDARGLPMPRFQVLKQLSQQNESAADSSLVHGDTADALLRARENLAAARQLVAQPRVLDALVGRALLGNASRLLARTALQAQQPALHSAALRVQSDAKALDIAGGGMLVRASGLLTDERLRALARDRTVHPAARMLAVEQAVSAMCLNTHDVLLGPSEERFALVDSMLSDMRDIPRIGELRAPMHRRLTLFANDPTRVIGPNWQRSTISEPLGEALLRLVIPATVQRRIDVCRAWI